MQKSKSKMQLAAEASGALIATRANILANESTDDDDMAEAITARVRLRAMSRTSEQAYFGSARKHASLVVSLRLSRGAGAQK